MLSDSEISEYKQILDKVNKLSTVKQEIITTIKNKNLQGIELLKSHGYESAADLPKLKEELAELEIKIKEQVAEAEAEILEINNLREAVENIVVG